MVRGIEIRKKCPQFRILIIGRSNAGKTTILKKVCDSIDEPMIFDPRGKEIDPSVVASSAERGEHDIENEMIFKSNPQFVFHDSRGFECGSIDETKIVQDFVRKREKSTEIAQQLHAIWYCLPTDTDRPILAADETFFQQCGTGNVPVIAIFTKFDSLITTSYGQLRDTSDLSMKEARKQAPEVAKKKLDANFIAPLHNTKFPPKAHLYLQDMQEKLTTCSELMDRTAEAIDDDALQLLFVSVQQNNVDLCIRHAVESVFHILRKSDESGKVLDVRELVEVILQWFPHIWTNFDYDELDHLRFRRDLLRDDLRFLLLRDRFRIFLDNVEAVVEHLMHIPNLLEMSSGSSNLLVIAGVLICTEQTFFQASASKQTFKAAFSTAFDSFVNMGMIDMVRNQISTTWDSLSFVTLQAGVEEKLVGIITENCLRI